jgi:hypothetical protein
MRLKPLGERDGCSFAPSMGYLGVRVQVICSLLALEVLLYRFVRVPASIEDFISKKVKLVAAVISGDSGTAQHNGEGLLSMDAALRGDETQKVAAALLPPLMDLWRRNLTFNGEFESDTERHLPRRSGKFDGNCSCLNPSAVRACCERTIRQTHKMGYSMTKKAFKDYRPSDVLQLSTQSRNTFGDLPTTADFRDVLFFRNIYASLKSGYLYHASGRECWLNSENRPIQLIRSKRIYPKSTANWTQYLRSTRRMIPDEFGSRTICHYLVHADEADGMRVYMDWVFHAFYDNLDHWALAHSIPKVRERTLHVCYEDFLSSNKSQRVIEGLLSFLFNQSSVEWNRPVSGQTAYSGGHSTHSDQDQSRRLLQIIHDLDRDHFNGEVAWLHAVLPC